MPRRDRYQLNPATSFDRSFAADALTSTGGALSGLASGINSWKDAGAANAAKVKAKADADANEKRLDTPFAELLNINTENLPPELMPFAKTSTRSMMALSQILGGTGMANMMKPRGPAGGTPDPNSVDMILNPGGTEGSRWTVGQRPAPGQPAPPMPPGAQKFPGMKSDSAARLMQRELNVPLQSKALDLRNKINKRLASGALDNITRNKLQYINTILKPVLSINADQMEEFGMDREQVKLLLDQANTMLKQVGDNLKSKEPQKPKAPAQQSAPAPQAQIMQTATDAQGNKVGWNGQQWVPIP